MANINLALNRPASASGFVKPYNPASAVDGNCTSPTSRWLCNSVGTSGSAWLSVDLGAPYRINRWCVRNITVAGWTSPDYNMVVYKLQGSNDNTVWTDIDAVTNNSSNVTDRTFNVVTFRYVRLYVTEGLRANMQMASLMEFEVYKGPDSSYLTGLTVSNGVLNSVFTPTTYTYSMPDVVYDVGNITVTPTAEDPNATIHVNGVAALSGQPSQVGLNTGINTIQIHVTSADGLSQTTYTITVTRASSPYMGSVSGIPGVTFSKTTYDYSVSLNSPKLKNVALIPEDINATVAVTVNGASVAYSSSMTINLNVGSNTIIAVVTSAVGSDSRTYTFNITRS